MKLKSQTVFNYFLFFLPFTQALTINIFFPLKISELLLIGLIFIFVQKKWDYNYIKALKNAEVLFLFLSIASISFLVNVFWTYEYSLKLIPFRIGEIPDSFSRLIYIYINVIAFIISIYYLGRNRLGLNFWINGAVLAAIYGWYLFASSVLNIPYLKLFGMEEEPQSIMGIVRSGTFKEGNFFSLFLLLSSTIAFFLNKNKIAWFLMASILTTFSTIGFISALFFLIVYFKKIIFKRKSLVILLFFLPVFISSTFFFIKSDLYQKYVYQKIFTPISTLTPSNLSKVDRYLTSNIAYELGRNNPVLGVGPNNYGLHYDKYNTIGDIVNNHTKWSINYFKREYRKAIPNNVYLEVWAEYGIIGFVLFLTFLGITLWISIKQKNLIITGGLLAMYLSLNAFPSFIMLFLWVYLAIPYAVLYQKKLQNIKACSI